MPYAARTEVPVAKTKAELSELVRKYGAAGVALVEEGERAVFGFKMNGRVIRFVMETPEKQQEARSLWRALLLSVKAKLESQARGIETFDDAFLAHIVTADGIRVGDAVAPRLEASYRDGGPPLLPPA